MRNEGRALVTVFLMLGWLSAQQAKSYRKPTETTVFGITLGESASLEEHPGPGVEEQLGGLTLSEPWNELQLYTTYGTIDGKVETFTANFYSGKPCDAVVEALKAKFGPPSTVKQVSGRTGIGVPIQMLDIEWHRANGDWIGVTDPYGRLDECQFWAGTRRWRAKKTEAQPI